MQMIENKYGIETLKFFSVEIIRKAELLATILKDGFQLRDIRLMYELLHDAPVITNNFPKIMNELRDLTVDESKELSDYLSNHLDLENDDIEAVLKKSFRLINRGLFYLTDGQSLFDDCKSFINKFRRV